MSTRTHRNFTLIELLAVMLLMGVVLLMALPAFNRMFRGNKVEQMTSNLKLGLEQAQAEAVSSRRYVALVLPTKLSTWTDSSAKLTVYPFCYGGYRLAFVTKDSSDNWQFIRWVPSREWTNAPNGAMLVDIRTSDPTEKEGDTITPSKPLSNTYGTSLFTLSNVRLSYYDAATSAYKFETISSVADCAIIFSPYGNMVNTSDLWLVVEEAILSGSTVAYPVTTNWLMLGINKFTGRVQYYPSTETTE